MEIKCHHCMHVWDYTGNSTKYVVCPHCHYNCMIKKDSVSESENNSLTHTLKTNERNDLQNKVDELENKITYIESIINTMKDTNLKEVKHNIYTSKGRIVICPKCHHQWQSYSSLKVLRCANCNSRIYLE